uniref:Uncharacterized protein n=1 Tax=Janibacter limosus TaxID=53458 RepID=A0AC61U167_9MICO
MTEHGDDFVLSIDHAAPGEGIDRDKVAPLTTEGVSPEASSEVGPQESPEADTRA